MSGRGLRTPSWMKIPAVLGARERAVATAQSAASLRILVVDGDAVSRRFVEMALADGQRGITVAQARDVTGALEQLQNDRFDLVILDTSFPEMPGLQFLSILGAEERWRELAFVFLTADEHAATVTALLDAGADEVLVKPLAAAVLRARVRAVMARRRERIVRFAPHHLLSGRCSVLGIAEILSLLEVTRRTGLLIADLQGRRGEVLVRAGVLWCASFAGARGPAAIFEMVGAGDGEYVLTEDPGDNQPRDVFESASSLILEAARRLDEARARKPRTVAPPPPTASLAPASGPSAALARRFAAVVANEFSLAELRLWSNDELARWTRDDSSERFHVLLVAPLDVAVPAVLTASAPPGESWTLSAMRPGDKTLGAFFMLPDGAVLDVVIVEPADVARRIPHLLRQPAAIIAGAYDSASAGDAAAEVAAVRELVRALAPPVLLCLRNVDLDHPLLQIPAVEQRTTRLGVAPAAFAGGVLDLRVALSTVIDTWREANEPKAVT